jgi:hypothetical protein
MLSKQEFITTFFRETDIPVAPSMERAFGYFGVARNPQNATAWLNLGLALRRMALYRVQDSKSVNERLAFSPHYEASSGRWGWNLKVGRRTSGRGSGGAFTYHQLGRFHDEVSCCWQAVELDRSDPCSIPSP